jgi:GNAT superfamily N-acetyltransferase
VFERAAERVERPGGGPQAMAVRDRAIAYRRMQQSVLCDRVEPWRHGTLMQAREFPLYYDFNVLRVEDGDPGVEAAALAAVADDLQAGFEHRRIEVDDEEAGRRLRPGFEVLGWRVDRLAWLHRPAEPPAVPAPHGVVAIRPAEFVETRPLRLAWKEEDNAWNDTGEFTRVEEDAAARRGVRAMIAGAGEPVGFTTWSAAGAMAEIELAFCLPAHRGRGIGAALLARTIAEARAAGVEEMLIVADDDGDSKRLYERLGFRTVWRQHLFTRLPPAP